jgi:competence protein ComGF
MSKICGENSDVLKLHLLLHKGKGLAPTLYNFTSYQIHEMKHFALISVSLKRLSTKSFISPILNNT